MLHVVNTSIIFSLQERASSKLAKWKIDSLIGSSLCCCENASLAVIWDECVHSDIYRRYNGG